MLEHAFFNIDGFHHAIVHHHRVAFRTPAQAEIRQVEAESNCFSKGAIIRQHGYFAVDIMLFAPGLHHEWIVDGNTSDFVNALGFEFGCFRYKSRQMTGGADRCVGAGQAENYDFAPLQKFSGVDIRNAACGELLKHCGGDWISGFDRHFRFLA